MLEDNKSTPAPLDINSREEVKTAIIRAYELHQAEEILEALLKKDRVSGNCILKNSLQRELQQYRTEKEEILNTPTKLLNEREAQLLELVQYRVTHNVHNITKIQDNPKLSGWLSRQRQKSKAFLNGNRHKLKGASLERVALKNTRILEKLSVQFSLYRIRTYGEHLEELRAFFNIEAWSRQGAPHSTERISIQSR